KSITQENDLGKTEWIYDALNRADEKRRYTDVSSSAYDAWDIVPGVQLDLPTSAEDDDLKAICRPLLRTRSGGRGRGRQGAVATDTTEPRDQRCWSRLPGVGGSRDSVKR